MYTSGENYKTLELLMKAYEAKSHILPAEDKAYNGGNSKNKRPNMNLENISTNITNKDIKPTLITKSPKKQSRPSSVGTGGIRSNMNQNTSMKKNPEEDYEVLDINALLLQEEDERFRYLLKYGNIKRIEKNNAIIYAELPQIPGTLVFYRKITERETNPERLFLDNKELSHIPLLEGEEALKLLSLKNNQIDRVQNLVSLPNLIYLDLSGNKITELDSFQGLVNLRVLIAAKNKLTKIRDLGQLTRLEILDLHGNQINSTDGLKLIFDLRTLNLKDNAISRLDDFAHLFKLTELNLTSNKIDNLDPLAKLKNLNKLFLSKNNLSKVRAVKALKYLSKLTELEMEENPISENKEVYYQTVLELCGSLETLDTFDIGKIREEMLQVPDDSLKLDKESKSSQKPENNDDDSKADYNNTTDLTDIKNRSNIESKDQESELVRSFSKSQSQFRRKGEENTKPKPQTKATPKYKSASPNKKLEPQSIDTKHKGQNTGQPKSALLEKQTKEFQDNEVTNLEPERVIQIIEEQFFEEVQRVERLKKQGVTTRKELYKDSVLEGGHAEMENNNILFLYGNAFEVMLPNPTFQTTVEEIHFQYVLFDLLVQTKYMNHLKQYKNLKKVVLFNNNIHTFLQIAKLESLPYLKSLSIKDNQVCSCELLKEFIIYRFPELIEFNDTPIEENQKALAKNKFKEFDNVLVFPLEFYKDNYKGQASQKVVDEYSEAVMKTTITEAIELKNKKDVFEILWSSYISDLIKNSLGEIKVNKNTYY